MRLKPFVRARLLACVVAVLCTFAQESAANAPDTVAGLNGYRAGVEKIVVLASDLIGIRYRRRGDNPQTGFDCSGFVDYVFREGVGLVLPHGSRAISKAGMPVTRDELEPGDLVFFKTMRHAFSHVGIYLGDHMFIHAPRSGKTVRIDNLRKRYWARRYDGARRISGVVAEARPQ
jgi:cell wall-associated NlpC family hydrolase